MSCLPSRTRLVQVLSSITKYLPAERASLLGHSRFAGERAALDRLANSEHSWAAARSMSEAEAAWLAETLLARWAELGPVTLDPMAAILGPQLIWLPARASRAPGLATTLGVAVDGLDADYRVRWESASIPEAQRHRPNVELCVPNEVREIGVRLTIEGKCRGERRLLVDQVTVRTAVPVLSVRNDRKQVVIRDQNERPAADANVRIGEADYRSDATGSVMLDEPAAVGAEVWIEGVFAGNVSGGDPGQPQSTTGRRA